MSGSSSVKPPTAPEPVLEIADVVRAAEDEGRSTSISSYIAEGIGIKNTQIDSSPVQARALSDTQREFCVIDDTGALLFMMKEGDTTAVYLANHAGVLQVAGRFYPGRFRSQEFKSISKDKAASGFTAEKEFWINKVSPGKYGAVAKPVGPISTPASSKPVTAVREAAAPKASATAAGENDKLSQMTPKERIKYLNQQMRQAKQDAKQEKKESAKKQKLDTKTAAQKSQNTDSDAPPAKKKISWF
jgi:hypothetical protein